MLVIDMMMDYILESTRAITIHASVTTIWQLLVQIGQGRGGFYSYERLENLGGCDIHNANQIMPEYQDLKIGGKVRLGPEGYPVFDVNAIEPDRSLILIGIIPSEEGMPTTWGWDFYLDPIDENSTWVILRSRLDCEPNFANTLIWLMFTDPIAFNVERKMLQGIKVRAEAAASN